MIKDFKTFYNEYEKKQKDGVEKILQTYGIMGEIGTAKFSESKNNTMSGCYINQELRKQFDAGEIKYSENVKKAMGDYIFLGHLMSALGKYKCGEWENLDIIPATMNLSFAKFKKGFPVEVITSIDKSGSKTVDVKFTTKTDVHGAHYTVIDFA